jgi:hypothetical protein
LKNIAENFLSKYPDRKDKLEITKFIGFSLNMMKGDVEKRKINLSNSLFKSLDSRQPGNIGKLFSDIGFTKRSETSYEYELPQESTGERANENEFSSNQQVLEYVNKVLDEIAKQE